VQALRSFHFLAFVLASGLLFASTNTLFGFEPSFLQELKVERTAHVASVSNGIDPRREDGVVYAYWGLDRDVVKIGVGNQYGRHNYTSRNEVVRARNPALSFDMRTRCVVRALTRAEAWTVELLMHLTYRERWVLPNPGEGIRSTEVFSVGNRSEVCGLMISFSHAVRELRDDEERDRMARYHQQFEGSLASEADDVTDWDAARRTTTLTDAESVSLAEQTERSIPCLSTRWA